MARILCDCVECSNHAPCGEYCNASTISLRDAAARAPGGGGKVALICDKYCTSGLATADMVRVIRRVTREATAGEEKTWQT